MGGSSRIGFRGDDRDPSLVFKEGMSSKDLASFIQYDEGIIENTAVCLSWRLSAASYFPLPKLDFSQGAANGIYSKDTWIYVIHVDLSEAKEDSIFSPTVESEIKQVSNESRSNFVNTHARQALDLQNKTGDENLGLRQTLFADEVAVKSVKPENILFAVKCSRIFNNAGLWRNGGHYILGSDLIENPHPNPKISPEMLSKTKKFLENEIKAKENKRGFEMPLPASGYLSNELKNSKQRK